MWRDGWDGEGYEWPSDYRVLMWGNVLFKFVFLSLICFRIRKE